VAPEWLPLVPIHDYHVTLRLDPSPRPVGDSPANLPVVEVFLNEQLISTLNLTWNPQRVGGYQLAIPRSLVRDGRNRLVLRPKNQSGGVAAISFWYVRVRPPGS